MSSTARKLASGSALRVFNLIVQVLVAFFLMPFVVHSLGDRMYGFWTLIGTFIGYYGLLDFGLSSAVNRHIAGAIGAGKKEECNRIFNTTLLLYSGLGTIALLITLVLAGLAPVICRNPEDAALFWKVVLILGVNMAMDLPLRVFYGILTAQLRFDLMSATEIISLVLRTILIVVALTYGYKVLALAWVTFLSGIPGKILCIYFSKKNLPSLRFSRKDWNRRTAKTLFTYSSFAFIAQMADVLRFHLDFLVITAFISLTAVTHYKIASFMVTSFVALIVACMGVFQPLFSRQDGARDYEAMKTTFFFATKISICVSSFVGFGLIAWGKPFIMRWMGPQYVDAYPCLVILVLGFVLALWQAPSVGLLYAISKHRFYALFSCIEGVCNLLLSLMLVRHFGLIGVALGTFIPMTIVKLVIQPIYVCQVSSIKYVEYIRKMAKTLIVVCPSLILPLLISIKFAIPDYRVLFVLGFVSLSTYSLAVWFCEFSSSEKQTIRAAIIPKLFVKRVAN